MKKEEDANHSNSSTCPLKQSRTTVDEQQIMWQTRYLSFRDSIGLIPFPTNSENGSNDKEQDKRTSKGTVAAAKDL